MSQWIQANDALLAWLAVISVIMFLGSLVIIPWVVVRIPVDYFSHSRRHRMLWADKHPMVRFVLFAVKNMIGCILVIGGLLMLVLPGQGILSIAMGIMLLNFPGKYKLERWFVCHKSVLRSMNWLRRRFHHPPLEIEEKYEDLDSRVGED